MAATKTMSGNKPRTKGQIYTDIAASAELSRKQVAAVFDAMAGLIKKDLSNKGPGIFTVPGLMKVTRITKPATKAREGINPFTKQAMTFAAKPASKSVRARPIKAIKDAIA